MDQHSTFCVYLATNQLNSKQYIGITSRGVERRWNEHKYAAANGSHLPLHCALRRYGLDAFTVELLETCADYATLIVREQDWIAERGTVAPRGYNVTRGGLGHAGVPLSLEHRQAIAKANRENKETRCSPAMKARMREVALARGPEHLAKIAASLTGSHPTAETRAKIRTARARQVFTREVIDKRTAKLRGGRHTEQARANMSRAQTGRIITPAHRLKIAHTLSRLTDAQAAIIRYDGLHLRRQKDYAALFGMSVQAVNGIVKGRSHTHVTPADVPADPWTVVLDGKLGRATGEPA